jgi:hypothetical protein
MTPLPPTVSPPSPRRLFVNRDARSSQALLSNAHAFLNRDRATACKRWCEQGPHPCRGKASGSQIWRPRPCWAIFGSKSEAENDRAKPERPASGQSRSVRKRISPRQRFPDDPSWIWKLILNTDTRGTV